MITRAPVPGDVVELTHDVWSLPERGKSAERLPAGTHGLVEREALGVLRVVVLRPGQRTSVAVVAGSRTRVTDLVVGMNGDLYPPPTSECSHGADGSWAGDCPICVTP